MAASRITWTPVPNGYANGKLRLSVHVSPRLSGAGTLDGYADWLRWPTTRLAFTVRFGTVDVPATITSAAPRSDLWNALFGPATPVRVRAQLHAMAAEVAAAPPVIRSWPSTQARDLAAIEHANTLARSPSAPPTIGDRFRGGIIIGSSGGEGDGGSGGDGDGGGGIGFVLSPANDLYLSPSDKQVAIGLIDERLSTDGIFLGGQLHDPATDRDFSADQVAFLLAELFHDRGANANPRPVARSFAEHTTALSTESDMDFHAAVGAFAQYPALRRALGLVVDLQVDPAAAGPLPPGGTVHLSLRVDWAPQGPEQYEAVYPVVLTDLTATTFRATEQGTTSRAGLLRLDTDVFDVVEVDADGTAGALSTYSQTVNTRNEAGVLGDPSGIGVPLQNDSSAEPAPLPSLRSNGFSVVQTDRAQRLRDRLATSGQRVAGRIDFADQPLSAEELAYGLRVDVYDDTERRWFSLCRRDGVYHLDGLDFHATDEGVVTLAHTQTTDDPTIYLHESLFRWLGYSLVANRPGSRTENVNGSQVTVGPDSPAGGPVRMSTSFAARGLAKLRFGRGYRFRARVVDIAGNSLAPDAPPATDFSTATPLVRYLRFEPVPSPLLLPLATRTVAESLELMVIRGNYDRPATEDCQRHVVPRRTSQLTAEQHGVWDVPPTVLNPGGIDTAAYDEIVRRDAGDLGAAATTDPDGWGDSGYYPHALSDVPYLPDVCSRGVALRGLPGLGADEVFTVRFDDLVHWPARRPVRVRLVAGTSAPRYDALNRVLTVALPPGRAVRVGYSSLVDDPDVDLFGPWQWFLDSEIEPEVPVDQLRVLATKGQLWQLTPSATLNLVHASRQPVRPATLGKPIAVRQPGQTVATFLDSLAVDRASTATVDVRLAWLETVDVLTDEQPSVASGSAALTRLRLVAGTEEGDTTTLGAGHEFHDTRHRRVTVAARATSRFTEFFEQDKQVTLAATTPVTLDPAGIGVGSLTVLDPATGASFVESPGDAAGGGGDFTVNYVAGTVARTPTGSVIPDGATVTARFVAGPTTRDNSEAQPTIVVNVRSSARPAAPDVAYLVPTFGWQQTADANTVTSTRRGNGLRIYLRRPWYSSGDGEQLGVVLFDGTGAPDAELARYVTLRAQDPLFASGRTSATPTPADFGLAVHPGGGYRLAENENVTVAVAPHDVAFDPDRGLWFCDVTVAQDKAYTPFLRLALARFQPDSLTGVELSTVVLARFAQLSPDRTLTLVSTPATPTTATVTLTGLTYTSADHPARVTVLVQVPDPTPVTTLGWRTSSQATLVGGPNGWTGSIALPNPRGQVPIRLVVEEREQFSRGGTRLVYADALQI
jgi:hypothetical protein